MPHVVRPRHAASEPSHVTLRARGGLPSFRTQVLFAVIEQVVREAQRNDFRIVDFSVQTNHVHALVEAADAETLTRNMRSVAIRLSLRLNRAMGRSRGKVWNDRYHRHDLKKPREVRNAIVYVLANYKKHFRVTHGRPRIDPFSSAAWFQGWVHHRPLPSGPPPTAPARTMLLAHLWKKWGLVHPGEHPKLDGPSPIDRYAMPA